LPQFVYLHKKYQQQEQLNYKVEKVNDPKTKKIQTDDPKPHTFEHRHKNA